MKTPQGENHIHWLLLASAVVVAVVVYVAAFHNPAPGDDKEAVASRVDGPQPMAESMPNEAEPAGPAEQAIEPPKVADLGREPLKERQYASEHPLYFRAVFGKEGTNSTLGVLDEWASAQQRKNRKVPPQPVRTWPQNVRNSRGPLFLLDSGYRRMELLFHQWKGEAIFQCSGRPGRPSGPPRRAMQVANKLRT